MTDHEERRREKLTTSVVLAVFPDGSYIAALVSYLVSSEKLLLEREQARLLAMEIDFVEMQKCSVLGNDGALMPLLKTLSPSLSLLFDAISGFTLHV